MNTARPDRRSSLLSCWLFATLAACGGCGGSLLPELDPTADATLWFVAKCQGIEYRARAAFQSQQESLRDAFEANDVDAVAQALAALEGQYGEVAGQLGSLEAETDNVDADVLDYYRRFTRFHADAAQLHGQAATAARERDHVRLRELNQELAQTRDLALQLNSQRKSLLVTLSDRYGGRSFDSVDYH